MLQKRKIAVETTKTLNRAKDPICTKPKHFWQCCFGCFVMLCWSRIWQNQQRAHIGRIASLSFALGALKRFMLSPKCFLLDARGWGKHNKQKIIMFFKLRFKFILKECYVQYYLNLDLNVESYVHLCVLWNKSYMQLQVLWNKMLHNNG